MAAINRFLARFVGPNAAHMIDALVAFGLTAGIAFAVSPAARNFETRHAQLGLVLMLVPPVGTALASKFRKAAGQPTMDLVDALAAAVRAELAAVTVTPAASRQPASSDPPTL